MELPEGSDLFDPPPQYVFEHLEDPAAHVPLSLLVKQLWRRSLNRFSSVIAIMGAVAILIVSETLYFVARDGLRRSRVGLTWRKGLKSPMGRRVLAAVASSILMIWSTIMSMRVMQTLSAITIIGF